MQSVKVSLITKGLVRKEKICSSRANSFQLAPDEKILLFYCRVFFWRGSVYLKSNRKYKICFICKWRKYMPLTIQILIRTSIQCQFIGRISAWKGSNYPSKFLHKATHVNVPALLCHVDNPLYMYRIPHSTILLSSPWDQ